MWQWRPLGRAVAEIQSNLAGCLGTIQRSEDGGAGMAAERARFCVPWRDALLGQEQGEEHLLPRRDGVLAGQLLHTLCAMRCLTNLSRWRGSVITQNIQKALLWLPRGKELNGLQPRAALSLGGKWNRRRLCGWRAEGAKGGAETHGKRAGARSTKSYGPILKRDYFNLHNKKCRYRLNSTRST